MKALIICVSVHHGNTAKVAEAIAEVLGAEVKEPEEVDPQELAGYDLIGFGSGIYAGRHHRRLLKFVEQLPEMDGKKAFVFYTSGMRRIRFIHEPERALVKRLRQKGFEIVGEFSCRGFDTFGPFKIFGGMNKGRPNEEDLQRAREFGRGVRETRKEKYIME